MICTTFYTILEQVGHFRSAEVKLKDLVSTMYLKLGNSLTHNLILACGFPIMSKRTLLFWWRSEGHLESTKIKACKRYISSKSWSNSKLGMEVLLGVLLILKFT